MESPPELPPPPPPTSCWSSVVQKPPAPKPQEPISSRVFGGCNSSSGVSVAVVDANAIISGDKIAGAADKFVTVGEVLEEVRDPVSRQRMAFLPLSVDTMEPDPESLKKVVKFARETGDLQTLSDVDLKLIALTYMLESQIHGTSHLRDSPPPLKVVNVKNLPEAQMPGWGSNVPNLAEWEALEKLEEGGSRNGSRILPLKDLDNNVVPMNGSGAKTGEQGFEDQSFGRPRRFAFPKREIKIEDKKMVSDGIDASLGEDADNADDWQPAVSRSTHRRYLRRKARRESSKASEEDSQQCEGEDCQQFDEMGVAASVTTDNDIHTEGRKHADSFDGPSEKDLVEENFEESNIASELEHMKLGPDFPDLSNGKEHDIPSTCIESKNQLIQEGSFNDMNISAEAGQDDIGLDSLEILSQNDGSSDTSFLDNASSEKSWMLRSLSDSTVACVTSDYAMQNVILQIGLRLLAPGGMQIRQLNRWVLKCHACNKVTQEIGRIFCPKCGNGGTLRRVSVTVGENGVVIAARRQHFILRGTKFSLPMPQGGREAVTKNPILREDQLPHKLLYPKAKSNKQDQDFLSSDDIFSHGGDKRAPLKPPVRKALAMFSGKRNPNDNHFSRSRG
ncbi:RNA-binding protein NOB1 [Iris pallida]|uniref:RNA-binding protein NOB1 n=1 Tax=Iris pallida TaxID=29817 RepID=A0AAX6FZN0_IRIPA|nr:RNA-binding protein NOB1 [Iris pallida]